MESLYGPGAVAAVILSLLWTWLAFFRREIVVVVTGKFTRTVRIPVFLSPKSWGQAPTTAYFVTDAFGRELQVDEATYLRAAVGGAVTLRQWVDRWQLVR